jgi:hypothetical protein
MKKLLLLALLASFPWIYAQAGNNESPDSTNKKPWSYKGQYSLLMNQLAFSHWATGGESSIAGRATANYRVKYHKNKFTFEHQAHLAYGVAGYINKDIEKTDDKLDVSFSAGRKISKKWAFTGMTIFKSQFTNGYNYPNDSDLVSAFMSPAYVTVSAGLNYKPNKNFQMFLSPLAGKVTFVLNQNLANQGAYGVKKAVYDSLGNIITPGRNYLGLLGINILCTYKTKLMKNVNYKTNLNLYNNYLEPQTDIRWQMDVDWENNLTFKINEYMATVFFVQFKYDPKVLFPEYQIIDGLNTLTAEHTALQFKESLGIGLTYKIE